MIPLPSLFATPLRLIVGLVSLVAIGVGAVFGWRYFRDKDSREEIAAIPAIAENQRLIDTVIITRARTGAEYLTAVGGFRSRARTAREDPQSSPAVRACYDAGLAVISKCDSARKADSTLIDAYRRRSELMEDEAVRARRGKLLSLTGAVGYNWVQSAPAGRVGVGINFSDNWSITTTFDQAAKIKRDSTGKIKTEWLPSSFVGLQYHFGGRH